VRPDVVCAQDDDDDDDDPIEDLPGVWYSVLGTGNTMVASTCDSGDGDGGGAVATSIVVSVFDTAGGSCETLRCVGATGEEEPCGPDDGDNDGNKHRSTSWLSTQGRLYYILVQSGTPSAFTITVDDV
jgi:hypothetical protein